MTPATVREAVRLQQTVGYPRCGAFYAGDGCDGAEGCTECQRLIASAVIRAAVEGLTIQDVMDFDEARLNDEDMGSLNRGFYTEHAAVLLAEFRAALVSALAGGGET